HRHPRRAVPGLTRPAVAVALAQAILGQRIAGAGVKARGRQPAGPPPEHGEELHMIKKLMLAIATLVASMSFAFAQVDVNKADAAALDSVKGVGPSMSKKIVDERTKNGDFK